MRDMRCSSHRRARGVLVLSDRVPGRAARSLVPDVWRRQPPPQRRVRAVQRFAPARLHLLRRGVLDRRPRMHALRRGIRGSARSQSRARGGGAATADDGHRGDGRLGARPSREQPHRPPRAQRGVSGSSAVGRERFLSGSRSGYCAASNNIAAIRELMARGEVCHYWHAAPWHHILMAGRGRGGGDRTLQLIADVSWIPMVARPNGDAEDYASGISPTA